MSPNSQVLASQASELASAFLRVLDVQRNAAADGLDVTPLRDAVEGFCRDAKRAGVRPTTIRHFVGALLEMALPAELAGEARRDAVRDVERLVDHAYFLHAFH